MRTGAWSKKPNFSLMNRHRFDLWLIDFYRSICGCLRLFFVFHTDSSLEIGLETIQVRFFLLHHFCPLFPDRIRQVGVTVHQLES